MPNQKQKDRLANNKLTKNQKRRSINEFDDHDRDLYQEIMEEILEEHGINPDIIIQKIKEKKLTKK